MKLTNTHKRQAGMTLLELTVVILVLLSLISILFIGARAWKRGSDRAGCIMNIRNVQQAIRSHQNMNNLPTAGTIAVDQIIGAGKYLEVFPSCPGNGTYSPASGGNFTVTVPGSATDTAVALTCAAPEGSAGTWDHKPQNTAGW